MITRRALFTLVAGLGTVAMTPAQAVPRVVTIPVGNRPGAVAVNSTTGAVYVANSDGTVSVLGGGPITVGGDPSDLAVDETTSRVYVASRTSGTVTVLDGSTGTVASVVPSGSGSAVLDGDATANRLYVGSGSTGSVGVVDTIGSILSALLPGPGQGFGGARVAGQVVYFSSLYTNTVEVLDIESGKFVASVPVGQAPAGLALHQASDTLYVANSGIHHLSVVDGATQTQRKTILLRSEASSVAVHEKSHTVYANGGPDGIVKIDGTKGEIVDELSLGINPGHIAVDQRTGTIYVTDPLHDQVCVITDF